MRVERLVDIACKGRICLWLVINEADEVGLVNKVVDLDFMKADIKRIGSLEDFLEKLKNLILDGYVDEIILPVDRAFANTVSSRLRG